MDLLGLNHFQLYPWGSFIDPDFYLCKCNLIPNFQDSRQYSVGSHIGSDSHAFENIDSSSDVSNLTDGDAYLYQGGVAINSTMISAMRPKSFVERRMRSSRRNLMNERRDRRDSFTTRNSFLKRNSSRSNFDYEILH